MKFTYHLKNSLKCGLGVCFLTMTLLSTSLFALDLNPKELRSPVEPRTVSILQNRFFTKSFRPELSIHYGLILNEAYLNTSIFGARVGMFFGEFWGVELDGFATSISDSQDRKQLFKKVYRHLTEDRRLRVAPEVSKIKSGFGLSGIFSPFYGKMNFFDKLIIYSDAHLSFGLGFLKVQTEKASDTNGEKIVSVNESKTSFNLGVGQRFFIGQSMSVRWDILDRIFNVDKTKHSIAVDFSFSYFFL